MIIMKSRLEKFISAGVRRTVNKFREQPYTFFTETDLHSYLYHCLYGRKLEVRTKDGVITTCVHEKYPTSFRYSKEPMEDYCMNKIERRGNHDLVVLNPEFITNFDIKNVVNKDIRDLEMRSGNEEKFRNELVAAIELKYVTNNRRSFVDEVEKNVKKLAIALEHQSFMAYNLVFCNHKYRYIAELKDVVEKANQSIKSLLAVSYYENLKKVTPKAITNGWDIYFFFPFHLMCEPEESRAYVGHQVPN